MKSETPRTDKWISTEPDGGEIVPAFIARKLEAELSDKDRQLTEARAEIEQLRARNAILDNAIAEMTEEQAALCSEGQTITELVAAKDKLIEQMREALEAIVKRFQPESHDAAGCMFKSCELCKAVAAIAAAKGEV